MFSHHDTNPHTRHLEHDCCQPWPTTMLLCKSYLSFYCSAPVPSRPVHPILFYSHLIVNYPTASTNLFPAISNSPFL